MVVGGWRSYMDKYEYLREAEVVDLDSRGNNGSTGCERKPADAHRRQDLKTGAFGAFVNGRPLVCGGIKNNKCSGMMMHRVVPELEPTPPRKQRFYCILWRGFLWLCY